MFGSDCQVLPLVLQWALITFEFQQSIAIYLLIVGFAVAFFLAFAVGANDAANSWATSVGAGTVSLGWAYALGSLMETLGATFVSGYVIQNLVEGIINIDLYRSARNETVSEWEAQIAQTTTINSTLPPLLDKEKILMLGALSTLLSSAFWQISAIYLSLPVSGSHSIVSGLLGFTLVAHGNSGVNWPKTTAIFLGWIFSPLISMLLTAIFYLPLYTLVVRAKNPYSGISKIVYSFVFGLTISINCATILTTGEFFYKTTGLSTDWDGGRGLFFLISFWIGLCVSVMVYLAIIPCIINAEGDFALRCDCCSRGSSGVARKISSISNRRKSQLDIPVNRNEDLWLHQRRRNESFEDEPYSSQAGLGGVTQVQSISQDLEDVEEVIQIPTQLTESRTTLVNKFIEEDQEILSPRKLALLKVRSLGNPMEALDNVVSTYKPDIARAIKDDESREMKRIFRPLQVLSACTAALAHGGNDVGNAIGPLVLLWLVFMEPIDYKADSKPYFLLLYGGLGISLGLMLYGKRVIHMMGSKSTKSMTSSMGFIVEWVAAVTVLIASFKELAIPVSTTHCQIGGVVGAGIVRGFVDSGSLSGGIKAINFRLFVGIGVSMVATVPFSMALSAITFAILRAIVL